VNDEIYAKLDERVIKPTLKGMEEEGMPFTGVLFIGVMVVKGEPIILICFISARTHSRVQLRSF